MIPMKKQKVSGYVMAVIGFLMILINAAGYIFNLDIKSPSLTVMGLVFLVIGLSHVRKNESSK